MNSLPNNLFDINEDYAKELGVDCDFNTECPVLVITGRNTSGKSFLRRLLAFQLKRLKIEAIHLSQQGRTTEGLARMIYGSEDDESTGAISAQTFLGGMRTSRNRTSPHALIWDEPEIGMGDELQIGTANWLFKNLGDWPVHLQGVVLLTHSKYFVERAMEFPGAKWFNLDGYKTPHDWFKRRITPVDPEELYKAGCEKRKRLWKMLKGDE